jgi:hypothetical protein
MASFCQSATPYVDVQASDAAQVIGNVAERRDVCARRAGVDNLDLLTR